MVFCPAQLAFKMGLRLEEGLGIGFVDDNGGGKAEIIHRQCAIQLANHAEFGKLIQNRGKTTFG